MDALTIWPLAGLMLETPRLQLRFPDFHDMAVLAALAAAGIHDPAMQPFTAGWTDNEPEAVAVANLQWTWGRMSTLTAADWTLPLVTVADGTVVGTQSVSATDFAVLREVRTGSFLGMAHHGRGYGTEMRAAVLALAFEGLDAEYAISAAYTYNAASLAVSRKLGYREDGIDRRVVRGRAETSQRLRISRADWESHRTIPVTMTGLQPCLTLLGAAAEPSEPVATT